MSDLTDQGGAAGADVAVGRTEAQEAAASRSNWEERVAAARAAREKVLKSKGKRLRKPAVARPQFVDVDPAATWESWNTPRVSDAKVPDPIHQSAPESPAQLTVPVASSKTQPQIPATASVAMPKTVSVNGVVAIAFACFAGLGFGMVLSFGAVVAMGWVSVKDFSPTGAANVLEAHETAPRVQANFGDPQLAPQSDVATPLHYSAVMPIAAGNRGAPDLKTTARRDLALAEIPSPAPQMATLVAASEPASQLDFKPAEISVTFENPTPLVSVAELGNTHYRFGDVPPIILEKGAVTLLTVLPDMYAPTVEKAALFVGAPSGSVKRQMKVPTLATSTRGAFVPKAIAARPEKLSVFDSAIPNMETTVSFDAKVAMEEATIDVQPRRASVAKVPSVAPVAFEMPIIGEPSDRTLTMASKLGLSGNALQRISLVTFAPTSVSGGVLATHAEFLETTGFPVAATNRVDFKVSQNHVRYYSIEDERVAKAVAAKIGGPARDFTTMRNAPPAGRVEIWLQGTRGDAPAIAPSQRSTNASQQDATARAQLENRLINRLRRGDQFKRSSP